MLHQALVTLVASSAVLTELGLSSARSTGYWLGDQRIVVRQLNSWCPDTGELVAGYWPRKKLCALCAFKLAATRVESIGKWLNAAEEALPVRERPVTAEEVSTGSTRGDPWTLVSLDIERDQGNDDPYGEDGADYRTKK